MSKCKRCVPLIVLSLLLVLSATGCSTPPEVPSIPIVSEILELFGYSPATEEKTVTYAELDSDGRAVVDAVYNAYDSWKSVNGYDCTTAGFFYDEDALIFVTYYATQEYEGGYTAGGTAIGSTRGFSGYSVVHADTGTITGYTSSNNKLWALTIGIGGPWDINADAQTHKDHLANQYASLISD